MDSLPFPTFSLNSEKGPHLFGRMPAPANWFCQYEGRIHAGVFSRRDGGGGVRFRLAGGREPTEPYPFAVYIVDGCTSSLIKPNRVITAKHCGPMSIHNKEFDTSVLPDTTKVDGVWNLIGSDSRATSIHCGAGPSI